MNPFIRNLPDNILFIINTPGGTEKENGVALVPSDKLIGIDLDAINGKTINVDDVPDEIGDVIQTLYLRFGLEDQDNEDENLNQKDNIVPNNKVPVDLSQYLNVSYPLVVHKIVKIGWAI